MSIKLVEINLVLEAILDDFASTSTKLTLEQKIQSFAKSLQERTGLCYVMVKRIESDVVVFDSLFTHKGEHYQAFIKHSPKQWKLESLPFIRQAVLNGKVICDSLDEKPSPFFIGWDLPAVSSVLIPVSKSGKVISIIELGSEDIIPLEVRKDQALLDQVMKPFEVFSERISKSLNG